MAGIMATARPASRALRMRNAFDELPRVNTIMETRNMMKAGRRSPLLWSASLALTCRAVSFANGIKHVAIAAGMIENRNTIRRPFPLERNAWSTSRAMSGPPTAPSLSIAR